MFDLLLLSSVTSLDNIATLLQHNALSAMAMLLQNVASFGNIVTVEATAATSLACSFAMI